MANLNPYLPVLKSCGLFKDLSSQEIIDFLNCVSYSTKSYQVNECIFSIGTKIQQIGIVLNGRLEIVKENSLGHRILLALSNSGGLFGEVISCTPSQISFVSIYTLAPSTVLFIPYEAILSSCEHTCHFHIKIVRNLVNLLGVKHVILNDKLDLLMIKGIQIKLITYLLQEYQRHNSHSFDLPLNRNDLADFLSVSRPSLSRELAILKSEGLIDYYRNSFKLINIEGLKSKLY